MKRKIWSVLCIIIILGIFISVMGWRMSKKNEINNDIGVIIDELASGDYSDLVLSNLQNSHSEEYLELFKQDFLKTNEVSGQFITTVLNNSQIKYKTSLFKDKVKITVIAPDLYGFISNIKVEEYGDIDDFYAELIKYCMSNEKETYTVWADVVKIGEHWHFKYDQKLINVLLGGGIEGLTEYFNKAMPDLGGE